MPAVTLFSPAKLNLFLAIVGKRPDGFHDLVSLVAPVEFGDRLQAETTPSPDFELLCDDPTLALGETNLVLKAARAFRTATGWKQGVRFQLTKRIPQGAGLGGGSSNATTTLRVLNELAGSPLQRGALAILAAGLGSDCPLFLENGPVIMRGRGERIEPLPVLATARLRGLRVWLFKPGFGVGTPWAYARLAAGAPGSYVPIVEAEARLTKWLGDPCATVESLLYNTLEKPVFSKFMALPTLVEELAVEFQLSVHMSGSGSTCFAFVPDGWSSERCDAARAVIRSAWGENGFFTETTLR